MDYVMRAVRDAIGDGTRAYVQDGWDIRDNVVYVSAGDGMTYYRAADCEGVALTADEHDVLASLVASAAEEDMDEWEVTTGPDHWDGVYADCYYVDPGDVLGEPMAFVAVPVTWMSDEDVVVEGWCLLTHPVTDDLLPDGWRVLCGECGTAYARQEDVPGGVTYQEITRATGDLAWRLSWADAGGPDCGACGAPGVYLYA